MRKCRPSTGLPCLISTHPKGKVNCESDISSILRNFVGHPQNKILLSTKRLLLLYSHLVMSWKETSSNDFTARTRLKCSLLSLHIFKNMFLCSSACLWKFLWNLLSPLIVCLVKAHIHSAIPFLFIFEHNSFSIHSISIRSLGND